MSLMFALPGALAYGIADFAGGTATRRAPVLLVTAVVQLAGLVVLVPVTLLAGGSPSAGAVVWGVVAAVGGTVGLLVYLRALAVGPMGVVAPLSAVVGAGLPLLVGLLTGERLGVMSIVAIVVALVAIVMATAGSTSGTGARTGTLLALAAGAGFALFFVGIDASPAGSGLWSLLTGRATSVSVLFLAVLATRSRQRSTGPFPLRLALLSGVFDTLANVFFLLSTRTGELGVSAVVVSLYPVVVAVLAAIFLKERLTGLQLGSAGLAVGASVLLAVGG